MSASLNHYLLGFVILCVCWLVLVFETIISVTSVWYINDTFNHCFFVIPISIYLAQQERAKWLVEKPEFSWFGAGLVVLCLIVWLFAFAGRIDGLMHLAAFIALPLLWYAFTGWSVSKKLWFPLVFVLFAVPVGEELIPLFQEITATVSVNLLSLSGVPVYREGLFIQIPEGRFLVAEACSGVRFFISTVMLGALCSYLLFYKTYKRIAFFVFALVLPIVANILRAYGTMLVGHVFGMEHAAGADHLIYGWFFFALVTVILLSIGLLLKDDEEGLSPGKQTELHQHEKWKRFEITPSLLVLLSALLALFVWKLSFTEPEIQKNRIDLEGLPHQTISFKGSHWQSSFPDASFHHQSSIDYQGVLIENHIHGYLDAGYEAELIAWKNRIYDPEDWTLESQEYFSEGEISAIHQHIVSNRGYRRSVAYWYSVPGYQGTSRVKSKLQQALNIMLGRGNDGLVFILSVRGEDFESNSDVLRKYISEHSSALAKIASWNK